MENQPFLKRCQISHPSPDTVPAPWLGWPNGSESLQQSQWVAIRIRRGAVRIRIGQSVFRAIAIRVITGGIRIRGIRHSRYSRFAGQHSHFANSSLSVWHSHFGRHSRRGIREAFAFGGLSHSRQSSFALFAHFPSDCYPLPSTAAAPAKPWPDCSRSQEQSRYRRGSLAIAIRATSSSLHSLIRTEKGGSFAFAPEPFASGVFRIRAIRTSRHSHSEQSGQGLPFRQSHSRQHHVARQSNCCGVRQREVDCYSHSGAWAMRRRRLL